MKSSLRFVHVSLALVGLIVLGSGRAPTHSPSNLPRDCKERGG